MSLQDWVFALHLVAAATLVGGLVMSWVVLVAMRTVDDPEGTLGLNRVAMVAFGAVGVGLPGAIALGIWLAVLRPQLRPWHGWAIAAIVLWVIAAAALSRSFVEYSRSTRKARALIAEGRHGPSSELSALARSSRVLVYRVAASAGIVLIVIDMIYKPGA